MALSGGCYFTTYLCLEYIYGQSDLYKYFFLAGSVFLLLYFLSYAHQYTPDDDSDNIPD